MTSLEKLVNAVVPDVVSLYSARDGAAVNAIVSRRYDGAAVFEDGAVVLSNARGEFLPQFTALGFFPQVSVTVIGRPEATALASPINAISITFKNRQSYTLPSPLGGGLALAPTVTLDVDTTLEVDAGSGGRVRRHVDAWRSLELGGGAAKVPIIAPPRFVRSALGRVSSMAMRAVGVGTSGGRGSGGGEATVAALGRRGVTDKVRSLLRVKAD